jgi:peptidoglycan/xylan/chitin deacetylase (PgdA/CDA1 family)
VTNPKARAYAQTVVTPEELRRAAGHPLVTVGAHSVTHRNLAALDDADARRELEQPKAELERLLGSEVSLFSFPHGRFDARLVGIARAAGYRRVFTVEPTGAFRDPGEFVTGRVAVEPGDWPIEFWLKVRGAYRWRAGSWRGHV